MGAGAAAWAAAEAPDKVAALVLVGPFVRQVPVGKLMEFGFRLAMMRPWGRAAWLGWYPKLFPGRKPPDFEEHRQRIGRSLKQPGRWQAFSATTRTSHAPVEARLDDVQCTDAGDHGGARSGLPRSCGRGPTVAERLHGEVVMVPDAGHYPQAEYPEVVSPAVTGFLGSVFAG